MKNYSPEWVPLYGDVDITYGYKWVKDYGDYAEVLELVDLSNGGFDGAVAIETHSVGFYTSSVREAVMRLRNAIGSCGWLPEDNETNPSTREQTRMLYWDAMASYGYGDTELEAVLAIEEDTPESGHGWDGSHHVAGINGVVSFLRDNYGLEFNKHNQPIRSAQ